MGSRKLRGCEMLIVDLRGNAGGGLAFLRVMSISPPNVSRRIQRDRARAETTTPGDPRDFRSNSVAKAAFDRLVLKFGFRDDSVKHHH